MEKTKNEQVEVNKTVTVEEVQVAIKAIEEVLDKYFFTTNDPLVEYAKVKGLIEILSDGLDDLKQEAVKAASVILHAEEPARESGRFEHKGFVFELSLEEKYDFVNKAHRYANETGVQYRQLALEQAQLKKSVEAKTKLMKALKDNFMADHPNWAPDSVVKSLKYLGLCEVE